MLQVFKLSRANGFIMWPHTPHHWPTYNAQQNIHCDANKNHNEKTEKQVSSFLRVESFLLMAAIYWMICDIYKQQTCIRSEHVIRILLAFGHQGFPSSHHLWPEYCQPQLDTTVWWRVLGRDHHQNFCVNVPPHVLIFCVKCSHLLASPSRRTKCRQQWSDQMQGIMSWQTKM